MDTVSDSDVESISDDISGSDNGSESDVDSNSSVDSDLGSDYGDDSCTDDDYDARDEETGSFLYRYFTIFIAPNRIAGKLNLIFIKATLLYTKGEDSNLRM